MSITKLLLAFCLIASSLLLASRPMAAQQRQPASAETSVAASNVWSIAGRGGRPVVNQMFLQYFANDNLKKADLSPFNRRWALLVFGVFSVNG
jgi:hypothetical protein